MSLSSQFVAKYGKPTTDKTTAGKIKPTGGSASGNFLNAVQSKSIKPIPVQAAPAKPIAEPGFLSKAATGAKNLAVSIGKSIIGVPGQIAEQRQRDAETTLKYQNKPGTKGLFQSIYESSVVPVLDREKVNIEQKLSVPGIINKKDIEKLEAINKILELDPDDRWENRAGVKYIVDRIKTERGLESAASGVIGTVNSLLDGSAWLAGKTSKVKVLNPISKKLEDTFNEGSDNLDAWLSIITPENQNFAEKISSGAGSSLPFFVVGFGAGKGSQFLMKVSPGIAAWFGGSAAGAVEAMSEAGSVYDTNIKDGKSKEEANKAANKTFGANIILNILTDRFGVFSADKIGLKKLILSTGGEGIQEATQQVISNVNTGRPYDEGVFESGIIGSIIGGGMGTVGTMAETKSETKEETKKEPGIVEDKTNIIPEEKTLQQIAAEEEVSPTRITEEQTKAATPAEEKLITRIQKQIEVGNDTFVANLREKVAENPKLTKDLEAAIAKAEARIAALEQKPVEEKAQKVEKQEVLYRGGAETSMPKNVTAQEVIDYEQTELGNKDVVAEPGINLSEIKSNNLVWLTTTKKAAREYGKVSAVRLGNYRIVARDSDGGVLVEKLPTKAKIQPKVAEKKKTTSPKAVEQTKKKPVAPKTVKKQAQKPKYTEEQVARAELAKQTREMFSTEELKSIATVKKLMNLKKFAQGDIETLRRVRPTEVSDLVEAVRRIENNPQLDDDAALVVALGIPNTAQIKPSFYAANKDALYMAANVIEDSGEKHITNDQVLTIIRKYFTDKELPVNFLDNIKTRDGAEAWGVYSQGVVKFVNNPLEKTPTHEAVHAFLDLFTTPAQKDAYIMRTLRDASKNMDRAEYNKQIRETQIQATQPGDKPINRIRASKIWAEEKMANDFIDYVKGNNQKSVIRRFFDKVIRFVRSIKDPNNVENLYQDIINKRREVIQKVIKPQQDYFDQKLDRFKVTTKTLTAMKKELVRDTVSRQAIESYAKRQGITKPDIELIQETLKEFSGDKINVAEFIATVQAKIMPVALIRTSTYADYGTGHLVSLLPKTENVVPADNRFGENNIMETHIWDTPFRHGQVGHFGSDYGQKKVSYEIREVTEPDSGNRVYVVVESGVVLNQENINEAVASTSETREDAEQWIKDHSRDLEVKKSGLLGHTRVASTKTREIITKYYEKKIAEEEVKIKNISDTLEENKKNKTFFNKNKKEIVKRLNNHIEKMLKGIKKAGQETDGLKGFSYSYILERYRETLGFEDIDQFHTKIRGEILKGYSVPEISNPDLIQIITGLDYLYMPKKKITQKILTKSVENMARNRFVMDNLIYEQNVLKDLKNNFHLALTNYQNKPAVRHLLEVQSDPFQSHYALETELTVAKDDLKRSRQILENLKEERQQYIINNTNQDKKLYQDGLNVLEVRLKGQEIIVQEKQAALDKIQAEQSSIERQFMAVGSKYHERAIKEEIRLAANDLINDQVTDAKFRVPTPLTIAFIEGYTSTYNWEVVNGSLVKKGTKPENLLKAQMEAEMPSVPWNPDNTLEGGEILIPMTPDINDGETGDHIEIDGELWVIVRVSEDDTAFVIERENEDYVINEFDGDTSEKKLGDEITYQGSNYIVVGVDGNTIEIANADRVREFDLGEAVGEQVDSQMDEVYYEIKNLTSKYGEIDTAEKAQKVIDEVGEGNFDYYETEIMLNKMAEEDPDATGLDFEKYEQEARDSLYESEGEMMGEISYWEDIGYKNVSFIDGGYGDRVLYAEDDAEVIAVESPDSEYVIEPRYSLDGNEFELLQREAREKLIPTSEDYQKELDIYNKKVAEIKAKYAKLEEELRNKPVPAAVNRDGEYLFDPVKAFEGKQEYETVYRYYEREVLPFFRKLRKDATLVTDENGQQWWETTVTQNDQEAVEVYMRKSSFDSLNDMADQLIKSQKIVTKTSKASKKPVDIEGLKKKSKAYARIVDQMDYIFQQEVSYDQMTIAIDAANALEFVKQHPERALRIAKGLELPPQDITETAISIAMADQARESGNYGQWSELERLRSLRQTRRGQEIVSERGRITENSPEYFLDKVLQERKAIVMKKKGWVYEKKAGKNKLTIAEGIKQEVENARAKVNNRTMNNLESAQDILNRLTCKY